ncbi:hypothetical protein NPIL_643791 [Nephila pilipes]|uniref:Uncharacterized protein n=1 Tax=Nephila pilipes TaxID=299642 RepID=A0A8X6IES9_NEPPI|nr:hypothetical protein NPIL_643791 [Nephila pilipes]
MMEISKRDFVEVCFILLKRKCNFFTKNSYEEMTDGSNRKRTLKGRPRVPLWNFSKAHAIFYGKRQNNVVYFICFDGVMKNSFHN